MKEESINKARQTKLFLIFFNFFFEKFYESLNTEKSVFDMI